MIGLPEFGQRVKVWPFPGRAVQDGPRPVDALGGGRFLPSDGKVVEWSPYLYEQMRAGDLLLHEPPKAEEAPPLAAAPLFDPTEAARLHMSRLEDSKPAAKPARTRRAKDGE